MEGKEEQLKNKRGVYGRDQRGEGGLLWCLSCSLRPIYSTFQKGDQNFQSGLGAKVKGLLIFEFLMQYRVCNYIIQFVLPFWGSFFG